MHGIAPGGCADIVEPAPEADWEKKIPCRTGDSTFHQHYTYFFLSIRCSTNWAVPATTKIWVGFQKKSLATPGTQPSISITPISFSQSDALPTELSLPRQRFESDSEKNPLPHRGLNLPSALHLFFSLNQMLYQLSCPCHDKDLSRIQKKIPCRTGDSTFHQHYTYFFLSIRCSTNWAVPATTKIWVGFRKKSLAAPGTQPSISITPIFFSQSDALPTELSLPRQRFESDSALFSLFCCCWFDIKAIS